MASLMVFYRLHFNKIEIEKKSEKIFVGLCIVLYICIFIDTVSWIVDGAKDYEWLNALSNGLVYIIEFVHGLLFCEYVFDSVDNKTDNTELVHKVIEWINIVALVIRVLLVLFGTYFYIEDGVYVMRDLSTLSFFYIPIMTLFVCGIACGKDIKPSKLITLLSYPLSSLAMIGISLVNIEYANSMTTLSLSIILIYCSLFVDTNKTNVDLSKSFQTYISDSNINEEVDKDVNTCSASLLFCNLHNFSQDMEAMEPEDGVIVLNNFYSEMIEAIETNYGKLLEYPGYGLFAIFTRGEHVDNVINAAGDIIDKLEKVNGYNLEHHYPKMKVGIGINTGDVILGNIGSHNHVRYSAIGKNVNLASRVETYSKDGEIILTEYTYAQCKNKVEATLVGEYTPKGLISPISIYKLKGKYVRF